MPGGEHLCPGYQPGDEIDEGDQGENFPDGFIIGRGGVGNRNYGREKGGGDEPPCGPRDGFVRRLPGPRRAGLRTGWVLVGAAGRSAVSAASSAPVRAANAWPARRSSSSLVSRPCANAAVSVPMACSRTVSEAMGRRGG